MSVYGGFNFTNFRGVRLSNTAAIRFVGDGGNEGTLSVRTSQEAAREWILPDKTGGLPIAGTFAVQLKGPGAAENSFSTIVTVSGIRAEDALIVQVNRGKTGGYDLIGANSGSTAFILTSAKPNNGSITLMFYNALGATSYVDLQCSYIAMR